MYIYIYIYIYTHIHTHLCPAGLQPHALVRVLERFLVELHRSVGHLHTGREHTPQVNTYASHAAAYRHTHTHTHTHTTRTVKSL